MREKLEEFEREVHGLEKKNGVADIGFGFGEVVEFYLWVVGKEKGEQEQDGGDGEDGEEGEGEGEEAGNEEQ